MAAQPRPDADVPAFLQLAGHPLRWRLLGELARSDRVVHELTERVGEPQNLVSYHLAKLREGRLVSSRRSSADRRDTYYGLDLRPITEPAPAEQPNLHDPALWADDSTLVYALPGDYGSDLWTVPADGSGTARRLMTSAVAPAYLG